MSGKMKDQTPRKEVKIRRSKETSSSIISEQSKKPSKISLNCEFTADSDDFPSPKSIVSTPVSEVSSGVVSIERNLNAAFTAVSNDFSSPMSKASDISSITEVSDGITYTATLDGYATPASNIAAGQDEADHIIQALVKMMNSTDSDLRTKKLMNALIPIMLKEFSGLPEEKDLLFEIVNNKYVIMLKCFVLWIFGVSVLLYVKTGASSSSFNGPTAT